MSRYRKIDPRFWKDEKIRRFSHIEQLIVLYLFTAQSNRIGIFSFSPGEATEDLKLTSQTFAKGFRNVCRNLSLGWDPEARVLYLPTWWKYNPPENANNVIGNLKDLDDVPDSPLIDQFIGNLQYLSETSQVTFTQTLAKHYPKRSPSQEQKQKQEQEQEEDMGESLRPRPDPAKKRSAGNGSSPEPDKYAVEFEQVKAIYPSRDGDQRWQKALSHYRAARKEGEPMETILSGIQRYRAWCEGKGKIGTETVKQAATFMGPDKCWREPWEVPKVSAGGFVGQ